QLYGEASLEKWKNHFPINDHFLGVFLPKNKKSKILDIGCGDGNLVYWLNNRGFENVHGVDVSQEQIQKGQSLGLNNLKCENIDEYFKKDSDAFDWMIARDVFEHFTRQEFFDVLKLIYSNLNEGGKLIIQVPNGEGLNSRAILYGDITHEMAYTHSSLSQIAMSIGFQTISTFPLRPYSPGLKGLIRKSLWTLKEKELGFWKWIETGKKEGIFTRNLISVFQK
ncbi:MAG: class I SAM-dependent methyltransferase, partial [Cytophagales bacterium]